jgi:hemoglobin
MVRDPHPKAPGNSAAITEPMIRDLVHAFYADVRRDPLIGPIFAHHIESWDEHLEKLVAFWSSVTLMTGRYKGRPMAAHIAMPEISRPHFERWLALFRVRARDVCPPQAAAVFIERAERIAESLHLGISIHRGDPPGVTPPNFRSEPEPTA